MKFSENELIGAALIGFDMIDGPFLKWKKEFVKSTNLVNLNDFAMNFYLAFRGGNAGKNQEQFYMINFTL